MKFICWGENCIHRSLSLVITGLPRYTISGALSCVNERLILPEIITEHGSRSNLRPFAALFLSSTVKRNCTIYLSLQIALDDIRLKIQSSFLSYNAVHRRRIQWPSIMLICPHLCLFVVPHDNFCSFKSCANLPCRRNAMLDIFDGKLEIRSWSLSCLKRLASRQLNASI